MITQPDDLAGARRETIKARTHRFHALLEVICLGGVRRKRSDGFLRQSPRAGEPPAGLQYLEPGDGTRPRCEIGALDESGGLFRNGQKGLLKNVFRIGEAGQDGEDVSLDHPLVSHKKPLYQQRMRCRINRGLGGRGRGHP